VLTNLCVLLLEESSTIESDADIYWRFVKAVNDTKICPLSCSGDRRSSIYRIGLDPNEVDLCETESYEGKNYAVDDNVLLRLEAEA
jgi:hypothetical protein